MTTQTLPAIQDDPAFQAAQKIRGDYLATLESVRRDPMRSDLNKARTIANAYEDAVAGVRAQRQNLHDRRAALVQELKKGLPLGPGLDAGVSAADRAVLVTAFRAAVAEVRGTPDTKLPGLLSDAVRFGDDTMRRAVLTVVFEEGRSLALGHLVQVDPGLAPIVEELAAVAAQANGQDAMTVFWERTAFAPISEPVEVTNLAAIERAAALAAARQL